MAVETATYIDELNPAYPAGGEPIAQGDDHLRLLKSVLKATFPTLDAALSAALTPSTPFGPIVATNVQAALQELLTKAGFPSGTKLTFAQAAAPAGWTQVTDDGADNRMLRVVKTAGAGIGGSHSPILNNVVPAHTHSGSTGNESADHNHWLRTGNESADHSHGIGDPGHAHGRGESTNQNLIGGSAGAMVRLNNAGSSATDGAGTGIYTHGRNTAHYHDATTNGRNVSHTHGFSTDNGSSQTNWTPRYVDLILCQKD
jgi:hypothetical protein